MLEEPQAIDPNNIKSLLYSNQSRAKQHASYDYYEMDDLETEINEFMAYSEIKTELKIYEEEYSKNFSPWSQLTEQDKKSCIQQAIDYLENEDKRISSLKRTYSEYMEEDKKKHLEIIRRNNQLLFELDITSILKQLLNQACHRIEMSSSIDVVNSICKEIDMYLTILYLVIISNRQNNILLQETQLAEFLFDLIVQLKEHFTKAFPLKKLMLNVWKILLFTLGDLNEEYGMMKKNIRRACGLSIHQNKAKAIKCTPEDLHAFYRQSINRYPTFTPKKSAELFLQNEFTITPTRDLIKLMGLVEEIDKTELPFQTLFPSKNPISQQQQQQQATKDENNNKRSEINLLPFTMVGPMVPYSLSEANHIWLNHLYISVADYQIIHEREKAIRRWQTWKKQQEKDYGDAADELDEWNQIFTEKLEEKFKTKLNYIEKLYKSIIPYFQNIVVVMLKLLLSTMSSGKDKEAEIMEDVNITRNRETTAKAATNILLLLLKWFKISHVLKFEYLAQILIDSGCMLLILKLLGMQEVALLTSRRTDDDSQSFFGYVQQLQASSDEEEEKEYTNKRNLCWTINLLRILQMLSKRKVQRILLLVQYKSSAIIKKLLKVGHPTVDLYVLKNLKSQVPFLANMRTISAIYSHCLTSLNDDWLSTSEGPVDIEDAIIREKHLRTLVRLYNGKRYIPSLLPSMDEINGREKIYFYGDVTGGLPNYSVNESIVIDDVELDIGFKLNYRAFLDKEVYSTDTEEEEDDDDDEGHHDGTEIENQWDIGTPLPDNIPTTSISADEIANEINKLYLEELQKEFQIKQQLEKEQEQTDGWDIPNTSITNAWGEVRLEDEDENQSSKQEDPLTGIDWNSLTEDELSKRLNQVEEKTVQRWLNVDMDDPRYLKVLNTFETEIDTDDEGWHIWRKGYYIVMDNAPIRKTVNLREFINKKYYKFVHLLPYLPFLNPIEEFWSKVKYSVRKRPFNDCDTLTPRIEEACPQGH
ncbi:hypothetical protein G6F37_003751 [Rhizopus arrhizus]|nr:hypothetical protein G6F38_004162 [Rhizopus arrhizus]KAG1160707.1 hypothetical protein G6F37_003751 [Rhizopus arrhizus]